MKASEFILDRITLILMNIVCALLLCTYLLALGVGAHEILLILIAWVVILVGYFLVQFLRRKKRLQDLNETMDLLDRKYLFAEIAEKKNNPEERAYFSLMKEALRSMTEHVALSQRDKEDYKEFIEQWAHELKVPITSIMLACENNLDDNTRKILFQTKRIEDYLEQVLYYARLGNVEKDYMIRAVCLEELVDDSLSQNKQLLIQNKVAVVVGELNLNVFTDAKWLAFIINQIINNSVRYKRDSLVLEFSGSKTDNTVYLEIRDNGIGIKDSEIGRVFQKSFTGSNGRSRKNSTGMGLYLCKGLCDELGVNIEISSKLNEFTCVRLVFRIDRGIGENVNITKL